MRKFIFTPLIALLLSFGLSFNSTAQDLMITGVADGDLTGGTPKAIELYVVNDIPDLSTYGIDIAFNGATSAGAPGYNFPADAVTAGSFIYVTANSAEFNTWFGFDADYINGSATINGDDAIELYSGTTVIDVYGAVGTDGTSQAWEYTDGWAYRVDGTTASATFTEADWTFAIGEFDTFTDNASATNPMPIGTFTMGGGGTLALPFYEPYETWPLDNWTIEGTSAEVWESNDGSSYGPNSVTEGSLAAMFDVYNASSGNTTTMTTNVIDMDGAVNPTLSFDFWMDGTADANLWIKVEMTTDGSTWSEIFYQEQDGNISDWTSENISLTGTTATTQIRIIGSSDYGMKNLFVDNLAIEEVTCPAPSNLALDANTATEATFSWTENGTTMAWNLIYGAPGFDPTAEGTTVAASTNPYTITGLTAGTTYEVYVQADCGAGDLSNMAGPVTVSTDADCSIISTFPWTENFDGDWTNWCWTVIDNDVDGTTWEQDDTYITPQSGAWTAHGMGNNDDYLITPQIGVNSATLFIEWYDIVESSTNNNTYDVLVSTTDTDPASFTDNLGTFDCTNTSWTKHALSLAAYNGQDIYIAFYQTYSASSYYGFGIDDVEILEISCPTPSDLTVDSFTADQATFSWTENGSATAWNLIYGAPGFDPLTEGTTVAADAIPFTITGLTPVTEYDVYIQADCSAGDLSTMTGPVNFTTQANCAAPSDFILDANTATEATFTWTENGTATAWNLIYGASGFDPLTEGTTVAADAIPYAITGLTANTDYDVYLQADCGGDVSPLVGPESFTTDCAVFTTPFSEDFTSYTPDCWSEAAGLLADPVSFTSTLSSMWGADGFANDGTTGAARVNVYGTTRKEWLITPEIDLGDGSVPMQLEFDLALTDYGNSDPIEDPASGLDDRFAVIISTDGGTTWTSANTVALWDNAGSSYVYNDIATTGERIMLDLTGYTGVVKFGFYAESTESNADNDLFIDNVAVLETPDCATPSSLALVSATQTEATFSWTENGDATAWNLVYGTPGFNPETEGNIVPADANPFTVTGLSATSTYDVYVQADCGSGTTSAFSAPITFDTECGTIAAPYTQDFENAGDLPLCWTNDSEDETWEFGTSAGYGPDADHTTGTGYFAWIDDSSPHSDTIYLVSPVIDITALTTPAVYFWLFSDNNGSGDVTLNVDVWDGTDWNNAVASYAGNTNGWAEIAIDLSAYAGSGLVQVRFHADETTGGTGYQNDIAIDDVSFDEAPTCYTPSNFALDSYTSTSATFSWVAGTDETNWNLVYGATGFDPLTEGTPVAANEIPYTIEGLTAETEYEVYVQADCGSGDVSSFAGPVSVTTATACPTPTDIALTGLASDMAMIEWIGYGQTEWYIKVSSTSIDPITEDGDIVINELTTDNPYTINGLNANTTYYVYIQSSCGSDWSTEFDFTTECDVFPVPFLESFDSYPPDCWAEAQALLADPIDFTSTSSSWMADGFLNDGTSGSARINNYGSSADEWMITPAIDLGDGSTPYQLEFDLGLTDYGNSNPIEDVTDGMDDRFAVLISTDGGATWTETNVLRMWDNQGSEYVYNNIATAGEHVMIDLSTYSGVVRFAFYAESTESNADNDLFVDEVEVKEIPSCFPVTSISLDMASSTEATISWVDDLGSTWNIIYGPEGFDPLSEGTVMSVSENPYTITDLTAATAYDVYIQTDCGAGDLSEIEGPLSFSTEVCDAISQCDFTFHVYDSYGDGWNGASISVLQGGVEVAEITATGDGDTIPQPLCNGFTTELIWNSGSFDDEASFILYDNDGSELFNYSGNSADDGVVIYSFTSTCPVIIDLALLMPEGNAITCELTEPVTVPVEIENLGTGPIAAGETISFYLDVNGNNEITEDIVLSEDLLPGEVLSYETTNTVDFSALGTYEWEAIIFYLGDVEINNDFTSGYVVTFNQELEFIGAVNDTITVPTTDWPYTIETDLTLTTDSVLVSTYEWEIDGSTEPTLTVTDEGWYTVFVTTEECTTEHSVYVDSYNSIEGVTTDEFTVYPNPNNGQFMIEMNLVERQDVILSIFNSNGQLVREFKFDDIDSFSRQIDMNNVAEGLYLIRINAAGKMFNSQVVIR
jgi:hypothetical protein